MGGNAFPDTARVSRAEVERVFAAVVAAVEALALGAQVGMPPELADKLDCGDVDLHFTLPAIDSAAHAAVVQAARDALHAVECKALGGGVVSLLTPERYQVDLAYVPRECFQFSLLARGNGDLWRILNISLRPGLVVRDSGLAVRREVFVPPLADDVLLSRDPARVCRFLGVPELWDAAGEHPVAVSSARAFEIAGAARFFLRDDVACYLARVPSETRGKPRWRPMLSRFEEWLRDARPGPALAALVDDATDEPGPGRGSSPSAAQPVRRHGLGVPECWLAATAFGATDALAQAVAECASRERERDFKRACHARLNGDLVRALLPGLCGKDVGRVLASVRGHSWEACGAWLDAASREDVEARVLLAASALRVRREPLTGPGTTSMPRSA